MAAFEVTRSILINAPVDKVYATVRNFQTWPQWSPWLTSDPDAELKFAPHGSQFSWSGEIIGSGDIAITADDRPTALAYRLRIFCPWSSTAPVGFHFEEAAGGTQVTWTMEGSLPFFLAWMKEKMTAWIGMDYERGLSMLKDLIETGTVPSKIEILGRQKVQGFSYVAIRTTCPIKEVGPSMERDFQRMSDWLWDTGQLASGQPFSIYHKWDFVAGETAYTLGFPVNDLTADKLPDFVTGSITTCEAYVIRHTGPYRHLGNAWSAGYMGAQSAAFARRRGIDPFEIYENDPRETDENDLVTVIHFPVV